MSLLEIIHVCPSQSFSGLEQYALELAIDQKKKGLAVGFIVAPNSVLKKECDANNIKTIEFDSSSLIETIKFWPKLFKFLKIAKKLKILHLHSTQEISHVGIPAAAVKLLKLTKVKVVLQIHIWITHPKNDPLHRLAYKAVDQIWCSSEPARAKLIECLPVPPSKISTINYGRDVSKIQTEMLNRSDARRLLRIPDKGIVIGTVSRLEESKGIREFLDATESIVKRDDRVHVVVIGGPSPKDVEAEKYADGLAKWKEKLPESARKQISLLGPIADSYKYLKAFDLYVLPSHQETFSLALLDAQLAGLPVVGSQSGGTPEVVEDGLTGWLFQPQDIQSLNGKIEEALLNQKIWSEYGSRASARVIKDFNQSIVFEKIVQKYKELGL